MQQKGRQLRRHDTAHVRGSRIDFLERGWNILDLHALEEAYRKKLGIQRETNYTQMYRMSARTMTSYFDGPQKLFVIGDAKRLHEFRNSEIFGIMNHAFTLEEIATDANNVPVSPLYDATHLYNNN